MDFEDWNVEVVLTAETNILTPPTTNIQEDPSASKSATMAGVAVLRYEQDGEQFLCCCSTQHQDRTYTFKRVAMDGATELFQCVDCLRAVSHFNEDPAAIGTVRMEEGSDQVAASPDEPQGLPHLCRRQTSRQTTKKELGAKPSPEASPELSRAPTSSSSAAPAGTWNTPTDKMHLQRRKPGFPKAKRSSAQKPAKEEVVLATTAEESVESGAPPDRPMRSIETDVPADAQSSPSASKKKSPLMSLIVLDDSPEPPSGSTENPIVLDDRPPMVHTFGVATFKDEEKRVLLYESRRYKGRAFEFHHFSTDHAKSRSLYRCLDCKAVTEKLPGQKMYGVVVREGVIYRHDPDYLFGDDGHLCMTYDANGNRIPRDSRRNRAEKSPDATTEQPSEDAALSFGRAEFDEVGQVIKFRSKLHEGHVFEFEHCNTKNGRRYYVCRGCRTKNDE
ncbi:hypothetical protein AAVH_06376 [Aphelenchoides avenae]|nr:hypothetical protein AAVH_06376 [Aphelenchus avenae]